MDFTWVLDKLPTWFLLELDDSGIPLNFKWEDLTEEQKLDLEVITALWELVKKGLVEVRINPIDNMPEYRPRQSSTWIR